MCADRGGNAAALPRTARVCAATTRAEAGTAARKAREARVADARGAGTRAPRDRSKRPHPASARLTGWMRCPRTRRFTAMGARRRAPTRCVLRPLQSEQLRDLRDVETLRLHAKVIDDAPCCALLFQQAQGLVDPSQFLPNCLMLRVLGYWPKRGGFSWIRHAFESRIQEPRSCPPGSLGISIDSSHCVCRGRYRVVVEVLSRFKGPTE